MAEKREMVILRTGGEWSALYIDGKLVKYGDHYLVDEHIYEMFGIQVDESSDWMRGDTSGMDVAQTLDEVEQYRSEREAAQELAKELRRQASDLEKRFRFK